MTNLLPTSESDVNSNHNANVSNKTSKRTIKDLELKEKNDKLNNSNNEETTGNHIYINPHFDS